jgi:hypothetical protein
MLRPLLNAELSLNPFIYFTYYIDYGSCVNNMGRRFSGDKVYLGAAHGV